MPLVLSVDYPGAPGGVRDYTENLSSGGLFVRTERDLAPGERVALLLSFPGLLDPVEIEVQILRRRPDGPGGPAGVAVVVPADDAASRRKLEELVRPAPGDAADAVGYRLLLVEDNSLVAAMYTSALKRLSAREGLGGLVVELALDGAEALERLARPPRVDLVVTDVYMPVMSGFALLERMRADPALAAVPVVVITSGSSGERAQAARLGADFFLQKPVKYGDIVATVRTLLGARRRKAQGPR